MALRGIPAIGPENSVGMPSGATNLVTNGGAETNNTGYISSGTNTTTRSTAQAHSGAASLLCTYTVGGGTGCAVYGVTLASAVPHVGSMWVYVPTAFDGVGLEVQFANFTSGTAVQGTVNMSLRDQWQRVSATVTPNAGDLTGDIRLTRTGTAPTAGHEVVYVDDVQVELGSAATPYIETDGATATRQPNKEIAS